MFRKDSSPSIQTLPSKSTVTNKKDAEASQLTTITGEWLRLDTINNIVKVRGHAVLDSEEEHITADSATIHLDKHTGTLQNATLHFPKRSLFLAGKKVQKTGDLTYYLEDGWVTKCEPKEGEAPPWSFGWSKARITYEGLAHFTHATMRIKNLPVVYTPYLGFSTNKKRKTGLLMPEWNHGGRDGAGLLVPLFLNLSPSHDLTLYAGGLQKRGVVAGAEFRYVYDKGSKGSFAISYLNDKLEDKATDDYKSDGIYRTEKNRYWIRGKVDHDFGFMKGKLDLDIVSDRDYLQEYEDGLIGYKESNLQFKKTFGRGFDSETTYTRTNTAQLSKTWTDMSLNAGVTIIHDATDTPGTYHRWTLPTIDFSGRKTLMDKKPGSTGIREFMEDIDLTWSSTFANYWQENGVGGGLLDVYPKLSAPLRLTPYLETTASIGMRETLYQVDDNRFTSVGFDHGINSRNIFDFAISTSTIFMRDFHFNNKPSFRRVTHMIRPNIGYSYTPAKDQDSLPDFVGAVSATNSLNYGISNDFDVFGLMRDGKLSTRKLGEFKVSQSYDIREQRKDIIGSAKKQPFSDIAFDIGLDPIENLSFTYKTNWNVYGQGIVNYQFGSNYSNQRGDSFGLEYRYEKNETVNQLNMNAMVNLTEELEARADVAYSLYADEMSDATFRLAYEPGCWTLYFLATTTPDDDYRFNLIINFEDVGKVFGITEELRQADSGRWTFDEE